MGQANVETKILACPHCGAALPPSSGEKRVTCTFCGETTRADEQQAALAQEKSSRAEAERLFATLGAPPSWSQRVAAFLVNPLLWLVGFPFLLALLARVSSLPVTLVEMVWESRTHERLMHVLQPWQSYLLGMTIFVVTPIALLVWSLFGERVSARRELQGALAAAPPKTEGGQASCRACGGPLTFEPAALGTRCEHCGADNLVKIPARWAKRAKKIAAGLRVNMKVARKREIESRRRVRRAAMWRVPLVFVLLALVVVPGVRSRTWAGFRAMHYQPDEHFGLYRLAQWHSHADPTVSVRLFTACDRPAERRVARKDGDFAVHSSGYCPEGAPCQSDATFPLSHGDRLRLLWITPGSAGARIELGPRDSPLATPNFAGWFGDPIAQGVLTPGGKGDVAFEATAPISGWYRVELHGDPDAAVEPCIVLAPPAGLADQ